MNIISEILRGVWLINPDTAKGLFPVVHNTLTKNIAEIPAHPTIDNPASYVSLSEDHSSIIIDNPSEDSKEDSLLILNIVGPITKYDQFCGNMGAANLSRILKEADKLDHIKGHLLNIDSGGGEGAAAFTLVNTIRSLTKPTFAFVDGMAASAAYWIASACSFVCSSSTMDRVGSIGTYIPIADYTKWYMDQGIRLIEVYASDSTDKNRDYLEALDGKTERLQNLADHFNNLFLNSVMDNRKDLLDVNANWNTGEMFFADKALEIGLIDTISDFDVFTREILKNLKSN